MTSPSTRRAVRWQTCNPSKVAAFDLAADQSLLKQGEGLGFQVSARDIDAQPFDKVLRSNSSVMNLTWSRQTLRNQTMNS